MTIIFSQHAKEQLKRRDIPMKSVKEVIQNAEQIAESFRDRKLRQKRIGGRILEVITRTEGVKIVVITAYYLEE